MMSGRRLPLATVWAWVMAIALGLGLTFRVTHIGQRVFWVDEVATATRAAGLTRSEIVARLQPAPVLAAELRRYQQLAPERGWQATWQALVGSPEHAPLYFLLARGWVALVGDSMVGWRSFSVAASIVALPCMYWLAWELFASPLAAWLATGFLALSPFFISYAQEARPYSLWAVTLLLASGWLARSSLPARQGHLSPWLGWSLYATSLTCSLYVSVLSLFAIAGHGTYMAIAVATRKDASIKPYLLATTAALLAFSPWLATILWQWPTLQANTAWTHQSLPIGETLAVWGYTLAVLFFDVPASTELSLATLAKVAVALALLGLIGWGGARLLRLQAGILVITAALAVPVALLALDILRDGQAAATPRYLIPLQLGALLAIARLLASGLASGRAGRFYSLLAAGLLALSLLSNVGNLHRAPLYHKPENRANGAIAARINPTEAPLLVAEPVRTFDLLSLGHDLDADTRVQIVTPAAPLACSSNRQVFVLSPPQELPEPWQQQVELLYRSPPAIGQEAPLALWHLRACS